MKTFARIAAVSPIVAASVLFTSPASATGVDLSSLTGAVDVTTIGAGLLAIGALMLAPRVARMAVRWIKGAIN